MEENSHSQENLDTHSFHPADDDLENWTFVSSGDTIPLGATGNAVNHEDLLDNHSEPGSDSGSSIVVIETTCTSYLREESNNLYSTPCDEVGDTSNESIKELDYGFSHQPAEEFSKEQSPFFVVESPISCEVAQEYSQSLSELSTQHVSDEDPSASSAINEGDGVVLPDINQTQLISSQDGECVSDISKEECRNTVECNEAMVEEEANMDKETSPIVPETIEIGTDSPQLVDKKKDDEIERQAPNLMGSISSAEDLGEAINVEEVELLNEIEADESDDENWDLDIEAPVYSASLASSVSSLIDQQAIPPSPIVSRGESYGANLVKPDLLEEANRIEELDQYDYSSVSNPDLPPDLNVGAIMRERAYVHRPNQRLNVQLSFIVAFALAAVFGFALGNLIGLADNFPSRCSSLKANSKASQASNGWSEEQWRAEVQRLTALNAELTLSAERLAEELSDLEMQNSLFDHRLNELISENWDLKQSVGRIRYGKPVRSIEDRHTINTLQTENQELRSTVGKLRYKCGQSYSSVDHQPLEKLDDAIPFGYQMPVPGSSLAELLGALNRTDDWNKLVDSSEENFTFETLSNLKDTATDLVELISLRRDELANLTKENDVQSADKIRVTLHKSASKAFSVIERLRNHQSSWGAVIAEEQNRIDKIRAKVENRWKSFMNPESCSNESCPLEVTGEAIGRESSSADSSESFSKDNEKKGWVLGKKLRDSNLDKDRDSAVDPDWYLLMGRNREKIRRDEEKSEWLFERAKNRDQERRSRKYQHKGKKSKAFKDGAWKRYAA